MALAAGACAHTSSPALTSPPAQSPQSSGPTIQVTTPQPVKTVGKASVAHDQKSNRSTAKVSFYVVGRPEEIKNVDVLQIEARIEGSGKESMKPEEVYFRLYSYSHGTEYKYKSDPKLSIFINGVLFVTGVCNSSFAAIDPRGGVTEEYFSPSLSYEQFLKLVDGAKLTMKFGSTEFEIKGENLEALEDLAKLVSPAH